MSSEKSLATLKILSEHCMRYKLFLESANVFKDRWVQDGHNDDTLIILSITNNFLRPNPMRTFLSWPSGAGAEKKIELVISGEVSEEFLLANCCCVRTLLISYNSPVVKYHGLSSQLGLSLVTISRDTLISFEAI